MTQRRFVIQAAVPVVLALSVLMIAGCPQTDDDGDFEPVGSGSTAPGAGGSAGSSANSNPGTSGSADPGVFSGEALNPQQKRRAEQITSVFENDTIELQYAYVENLDDGRGYTAGRAGFCTGTGDLVVVVGRYTEAVPGNELAAYLPRLEELASAESDAVNGLEGLPQAWERAAADARFRAIQDQVVDEMYYLPAVDRWQDAGLRMPLTLAALYDAIIQHGDGEDPDGLAAMMARATLQAGGDPGAGVDERVWLAAFLDVRYATLARASDPDTREAWALGADRPSVFQKLLVDGNFRLDGPIFIDTSEHTATIP